MLQQQERNQSLGSTGDCGDVTSDVGDQWSVASGQWSGVDEWSVVSDQIAAMTRGAAVWATIAALALVNLGLASLIASAVGARGFIPVWIAVVLLVVGVVAAVVAATLWRGYLNSVRGPSSPDH
jgi:protein-S-isoprenylcysteine O-methyltransferase Ste14